MSADQVNRDMELFAQLEPTLGLDSEVEIFDPCLAAAARVSMENAGSWWLPAGPIGEPLFRRRRDAARRKRIRATGRARKNTRGWR